MREGVSGCREVNLLFYREHILLRHLHFLRTTLRYTKREKKDKICWADRISVTANSFLPFGPRARRISLAQHRGLLSSQCQLRLLRDPKSFSLRPGRPRSLGRCRLTHTRLGLVTKAQGLYLPEVERRTPVLHGLRCNTFQGTARRLPGKGAVQ